MYATISILGKGSDKMKSIYPLLFLEGFPGLDSERAHISSSCIFVCHSSSVMAKTTMEMAEGVLAWTYSIKKSL